MFPSGLPELLSPVESVEARKRIFYPIPIITACTEGPWRWCEGVVLTRTCCGSYSIQQAEVSTEGACMLSTTGTNNGIQLNVKTDCCNAVQERLNDSQTLRLALLLCQLR
jgi:hypothetical protein